MIEQAPHPFGGYGDGDGSGSTLSRQATPSGATHSRAARTAAPAPPEQRGSMMTSEPERYLWRGMLILIADDADGWHLRHAEECRPQWRPVLEWLRQNGYVEKVTPRQWCVEAWQLTGLGRAALQEASA